MTDFEQRGLERRAAEAMPDKAAGDSEQGVVALPFWDWRIIAERRARAGGGPPWRRHVLGEQGHQSLPVGEGAHGLERMAGQ